MKLEKSSKRLTVRPYKKTDYPAWKNAFLSILPNKKNVWDIPPETDLKKLSKKEFNVLLKILKKRRDDDYFYDFGIFLKDGTLVGVISLMDVSRQIFQNAYIGYRIFNNHWGKGYAKEALKLTLEIAFKKLKLHRIEAGIEPNNKSSIAVSKSIGMRRESISKKRLYVKTEKKWMDMVIYAITCEEFGVKWNDKNFT